MDTPFEVLDVDPDADEATLRRAYRRRVKETHPDQGGSVDEFRAVRAAYEAVTTGEWTPGDEAAARANGADGDGDDGRPAWRPDPTDASDEPAAPETAEVEYLDYEVLDDRGWRLTDPDLFEKAAAADLAPADYGRLAVPFDEPLLESAEDLGQAWPFACRGGACANCAIAVVEGETETHVDNVLPPEMADRGIRLSCICTPVSESLKLVYNVKHLPELDDLKLPADRFEQAHADD